MYCCWWHKNESDTLVIFGGDFFFAFPLSTRFTQNLWKSSRFFFSKDSSIIQKLIARRVKLVNSIYSLSLSAVKSDEKEVKNEDESKVVTLKASTTSRRGEGKQNKKHLVVNTINFFCFYRSLTHEIWASQRHEKCKEKIKVCGLEKIVDSLAK